MKTHLWMTEEGKKFSLYVPALMKTHLWATEDGRIFSLNVFGLA